MSSARQAHRGFQYPQKIEDASVCLGKYTLYSDVAIDAYSNGPGASVTPPASGTPPASATDQATMERRIVNLFSSAKVFVKMVSAISYF